MSFAAPLLVIAATLMRYVWLTIHTADTEPGPPLRAIEVHRDLDGEVTTTYGRRVTPMEQDRYRDLPPRGESYDEWVELVAAAKRHAAPISPAPPQSAYVGQHALERLHDADRRWRINGTAAQWSGWVESETGQYNLDELYDVLGLPARGVAA